MSVVVRNFFRNLLPAAALAAVLSFGASANATVYAGIIVSGTPIGTLTDSDGNIGARIRWGANGWEAAIRRSNGTTPGSINYHNPINPLGTPAWIVGRDNPFQITWTAATGTLDLQVDFGGTVGVQSASTTFNGFSGSGASRLNYGYYGVSINNFAKAGATVSNLTINGTGGFPSPPLINSPQFFKAQDDSLLQNITISGLFKFDVSGTKDESISWDFQLRSPAAVPEPGSLSLLAVGLAGLVGIRRRRS